jgi:hypothetical protein
LLADSLRPSTSTAAVPIGSPTQLSELEFNLLLSMSPGQGVVALNA